MERTPSYCLFADPTVDDAFSSFPQTLRSDADPFILDANMPSYTPQIMPRRRSHVLVIAMLRPNYIKLGNFFAAG
jgi:hypothetical protein